jgi:mono/diheme cytochrome c family protein
MSRLTPMLLLALALVACQDKPSDELKPAAPAAAAPVPSAANPNAGAPAAAPAGKADAAIEAKAVFAQRCTLCHGQSGKGDGPASATLTPHPRNYQDTKWQESVTDDALREIIVKGGSGVGKSMMMPPNPDLKDKPDVVDELVRKIRSFKK